MPASSRSRPGSSTRPQPISEAVASTPAGALRAEALLFLARVRYRSDDAGAALALAEQALEEVSDDEELQPHIQLELAAAAEAVGDRDRARVHAREAVTLAEARGAEAVLAEALTLVGYHDFLAGEPGAADGDCAGLWSSKVRRRGFGRCGAQPSAKRAWRCGRTSSTPQDRPSRSWRSVAGREATRDRSP